MRPELGIARKYERADGRSVVVVDTAIAEYRGKSWLTLDRYQREKFENLVFFAEAGAIVFYDLPDGFGTFYDREAAADAWRLRHGVLIPTNFVTL